MESEEAKLVREINEALASKHGVPWRTANELLARAAEMIDRLRRGAPDAPR
jgi:argininosuccinate lyase